MLCLNRHMDETILINGNIEVTVLKIKGNRVILGVTAPQDISIIRKELTDAGYQTQRHDPQRISPAV